MKRNTIIIISLIVIVLCTLLVFYIRGRADTSEFRGYYQVLADRCESVAGSECCLSSVRQMSDRRLFLKEGDSCTNGYQSNALKCPDSYTWCEPVE